MKNKYFNTLLALLLVFSQLVPAGIAIAGTTATVIATKIVCDSEADLPNWGLGGSDITASTASDFLSTHPNCRAESGWDFQWGPSVATDPGGAFIGAAGSPWTTFGATDSSGVASVDVDLSGVGDKIWIREILKTNFLPFSYPDNGNDPVSAEIYCYEDVLNYDNYDFILNPVADETYHCVAFNVDVTPVPPPPPPAALCANGTDDDGDTLIDTLDPGCHTDGDATNSSSYDAADNDETDPLPPPAPVPTPPTPTPPTPTPPTPAPTPSGGGGGGGGTVLGMITIPVPTPVTIVAPPASQTPAGAVLGISCEPYLKTYIRLGKENDVEEVKKLQIFLNSNLGLKLPITGIYSIEDESAVNQFQLKYSNEVLVPWLPYGLPSAQTPTGYVYKTTQRWINMLHCPSLNLPIPQLP